MATTGRVSAWRILGVDEHAPPDVVKAAYRRLALLFHPSYAAEFVVRFGKHRGETIEGIWSSDPQYIRWLAENFDDGPTLDAVLDFLATR